MKSSRDFFSPNQSFFWGVVAFIWQLLFFYIPVSFLISTSFVEYFPDLGISRFTLTFYKDFLNPVYGEIFVRSFLLAAVTVIVALLISYPVAYYLAVKAKRFKNILFALLILPFWTNLLLLVYSWYFLLENDGIINNFLMALGIIKQPIHMMNSMFAVYMGTIYCYLPFMLLPLYSVLDKFDTRLLEASADLGATYTQTFRKIVLPLTYPGIKTGAMLVFVPSFGEFVIPALLGGDKNMYVGSVIAHYFLTVRNVPLGSAFTCFSIFILISAFCMYGCIHYIVSRLIRGSHDTETF